jgi:hypothetical protein
MERPRELGLCSGLTLDAPQGIDEGFGPDIDIRDTGDPDDAAQKG